MSPSQFIACRTIGPHLIRRCDARRALLINEDIITLTPTEYHLLYLLLEQDLVADKELIAVLFAGASLDRCARRTLKRHLDTLKAKLRPAGLTLRRIYRFGYTLVPDESSDISKEVWNG
ncbi:MAG: hypothetical protein IMW89_18400 [Ktedonobacteraceae bacterium]|nr:hypothetical protein [Ktedonobacteraceae bacterium]